ncbi:MAG: PD-(D/E)XK nuclease family protein, partial [Agathobacter sp.]|nr:PD-(D/E)XK nuclease family protein [Agathobacter sp.]
PKLQVEEIVSVLTEQDISSVEVATDYLLEAEKDPVWYALAKCFLEHQDDKVQGKMQSILEAMHHQYHHDPISKLMAEALYGRNISGSVTRLEEYAKCAYSHFLKYGLRLKEREESGFEGVDLGNLYHAAIEGYSKRLWDSSYNWFTIPDDVRESYAENAMEEALLAYPNLGIYATAESQHIVKRIGHIFKQTIWALTTQVRKGEFVPEEFEISFSRADGLKALEYELEDRRKIQLGGRIDRMDTCAQDNQLYIKVIDYKSGNTKFDLLELYYGQKLQLIVYMNAAMELEKKKHPSKDVQPAAMFYYHIDDPRIEMDGEWSQEQIKQSILKKLCPDGLISNLPEVYQALDVSLDWTSEENRKSNVIPLSLNKDGKVSKTSSTISPEAWECLSEYVENHIRKVGNEIYQGNIKVQPYAAGQKSGCTYCPYGSICGFDKKIQGYEAAKRQKLDKEEILERMKTQNALDRSK